jgi:hypothetical protein
VPGFDVAVTGVTLEDWLDPAVDGHPSRLNRSDDDPALRYVAIAGIPVTITAIVDGVSAPQDSALDGRLFSAVVVESPIATARPAGVALQSSIQLYTPPVVGHYLLRMSRPGGGSWFLPFDAEAPS